MFFYHLGGYIDIIIFQLIFVYKLFSKNIIILKNDTIILLNMDTYLQGILNYVAIVDYFRGLSDNKFCYSSTNWKL